MKRTAALLVTVAVAAVGVRIVLSSRAALREARDLQHDGETHLAAVMYARAIRMYLPGLPTNREAAASLLALCERARAEGDRDEERSCWEELRSGWLAVRSFYQPGEEYIARAEAAIAELIVAHPEGVWPDRSLPADERLLRARELLARRDDPNLGWVVVQGAAWLAWIACSVLAIVRGLPEVPGEHVRFHALSSWGAAAVSAFGVWLLALSRA